MSTIYSNQVGERLNALLQKSLNAHKGFKKAAERSQQPGLQNYFNKKSHERRAFAIDLETELLAFGQEPVASGSVETNLHRAWVDVKAFFSTDDDEALLEAAITGEKTAIEEYEEVLRDTPMPQSTTMLLRQQMRKIQKSLDTIGTLEDLSS